MTTYAGNVRINLTVNGAVYQCVQFDREEGKLWLAQATEVFSEFVGKECWVEVVQNDEVVRQFRVTIRSAYGDQVDFD